MGLERGGAYSLVAGFSVLAIDYASLSRRGAVPAPNRDTSNEGGGGYSFHVRPWSYDQGAGGQKDGMKELPHQPSGRR